MPDEDDIAVVRRFVDETIETYSVIVVRGRALRGAERDALLRAVHEFRERHPDRITTQYAGLEDDEVVDAGLYGAQLREKREVARLASDDLLRQAPSASPRRFSRRRIRRWLKRAKVLVGSLRGLIPARRHSASSSTCWRARLTPRSRAG